MSEFEIYFYSTCSEYYFFLSETLHNNYSNPGNEDENQFDKDHLK